MEQHNGFLSSLPNDRHLIEAQLMRKFICTQQVLELFSLTYATCLQDLPNNFLISQGSLNYENFTDLPMPPLSLAIVGFIDTLIDSLHPIKEACLSSEELDVIDSTLKLYFGNAYIQTLMLHKVSRGITSCGLLYGNIHNKFSMVYVKIRYKTLCTCICLKIHNC